MRAENRKRENEREDHMRMVSQDRMLRATMASDERVENKRFIRRLQQVCTCGTVSCVHNVMVEVHVQCRVHREGDPPSPSIAKFAKFEN